MNDSRSKPQDNGRVSLPGMLSYAEQPSAVAVVECSHSSAIHVEVEGEGSVRVWATDE